MYGAVGFVAGDRGGIDRNRLKKLQWSLTWFSEWIKEMSSFFLKKRTVGNDPPHAPDMASLSHSVGNGAYRHGFLDSERYITHRSIQRRSQVLLAGWGADRIPGAGG